MDAVRLGQSGLMVSPVCLGAMTFGLTADLEEAGRIADAALERGVFFWDTADMYAAGASEQIVGKLLRNRRRDVVLATKGWGRMGPGANDQGLGARHIIAACEDSLRRLGTDWIDLYYLHLPDRDTPLEETLRATEDLVRSGKVRYLGGSNYWAWEVVELIYAALGHGWQAITAIQHPYNLVHRTFEVELFPMASRLGLGVVTYSPLARGVLTGKYKRGAKPPDDSRLSREDVRFLQAEWREDSLDVVEALRPEAEVRGWTPGQLAFRWALANEQVDSVIMGARTLAQAVEALDAVEFDWDEEIERKVDELVPPGTHSGRARPDPSYYPVEGRTVLFE